MQIFSVCYFHDLCEVLAIACTVTTFGDEDKAHTMATHGSVSAFDPSKEDWTSYEERLRYYFIANDVADGAKKRSILLAACGAPTYKLIRSLVQAEIWTPLHTKIWSKLLSSITTRNLQ